MSAKPGLQPHFRRIHSRTEPKIGSLAITSLERKLQNTPFDYMESLDISLLVFET